jgi:hypothetical protein
MKNTLLSLLLMSVPIYGSTATDYQCVNDCTAKGYMYNLCQQQCSYDSSPQVYTPRNNQIKQTDYQCVNDCTQKGYQYTFCQSRCSY